MSSAVNLIVATCRVGRPQYLFERKGETGKAWSDRQKEAVVAAVVVHVWPKSVDIMVESAMSRKTIRLNGASL